MEKELAQSDLPVQRKIPKTTRKHIFSEKWHFGWFFGFFSKLVSPIDQILSPLSQCLSRACFDRSLNRSATTLKFDPIMGIFKFSDPRWRVKELKFSKNLFISVILIYSDSDFHLQYFANSKKVLYDPPPIWVLMKLMGLLISQLKGADCSSHSFVLKVFKLKSYFLISVHFNVSF